MRLVAILEQLHSTKAAKLLDSDGIGFQQDNHLMVDNKCVVPDGSYRQSQLLQSLLIAKRNLLKLLQI